MFGLRVLYSLISPYTTVFSGVTYGENSPNLCPTISSVIVT